MSKTNLSLNIILLVFALNLIFLIPSCDQILQPELAEITDADNDGFDDRDILFLQKLIDNSQGYGNSPPDTLDPKDVGDQVWTDGRLRSLSHQGGVPYAEEDGFYLYEIPSEIEGAQYLNKLKLYKNYLTIIPEEIKYLDRLTEINLEKNRFVGPVPEALWKNKNLASLAINSNSFSSIDSASVCDALENINLFVITHNNICEIPDCISDPGVQSCDCYEYQAISPGSICLDSTVSCNKYLTEVIDNCDLTQIWGDSKFVALNSLSNEFPEACLKVSDESDCGIFASDTAFGDSQINIDDSVGALDCNDENPYRDYLGWLGDGTCDEDTTLINFSCEKFNCDLGDCGVWKDADSECSCQRDCSGTCFKNEDFVCTQYSVWGWDCCLDDPSLLAIGACTDLDGNGVIQDYKGDGWCDDGTWGINFNCQEFEGYEFDCDGGDCGTWDEDLGECVMPAGKTLKRRPRY